MTNEKLVQRLTLLGWTVANHGYTHTWVEHTDGRRGQIPGASKDMRHSYWPTHLWDRIKRELRLEGAEIHG
jgi:predicted RNA binding protein YcfA (HicA-like mRNA interferase family)